MDAVKTGGLIAQVRREKELTQRDLAERLHVSVQAVSKWERGRSCPDIALLEPLAGALELTVTELLSGQRGEEPGEEAVRDSLRFGLSQLGSRIKTWRWLFAAAAAVLIAVLAWLGYTWVRDNTEWLPQRETVVAYISGSDRERQIAQALGVTGNSLHLYEVALADDFTACTVQAELWTHEEGLVDSWPLLETSSDSRALYGPRRQLLVLSIEARHEAWSEAEHRWTKIWFDYGVNFAGASVQGRLDEISSPYIGNGTAWSPPQGGVVDREEGLTLLTLSVGGPGGGVYAAGGLPPEHEKAVYLAVRMYCE